jgi:hypothetical protein
MVASALLASASSALSVVRLEFRKPPVRLVRTLVGRRAVQAVHLRRRLTHNVLDGLGGLADRLGLGAGSEVEEAA